MTEREQLIVANLLNGVPVPSVAGAYGSEETEILAVFSAAMKLVAEYQLVHCVPHFDCVDLAGARRNKIRVIDIMARICRWDATERDLIVDLLKGRDVSAYGLSREQIAPILQRTLDALPNYLRKEEQPVYFRDRKDFIARRRARVIEAVEKFVSFRNPLTYKAIEHLGMDVNNADQVAQRVTH